MCSIDFKFKIDICSVGSGVRQADKESCHLSVVEFVTVGLENNPLNMGYIIALSIPSSRVLRITVHHRLAQSLLNCNICHDSSDRTVLASDGRIHRIGEGDF